MAERLQRCRRLHHGRRRLALAVLAAARGADRLNRYVATDDDAGVRTDVVLTRLCGYSRSHVAAAMRAGAAQVNDEPAKPSRLLEAGDVVCWEIAAPEALRVEAEDIPLRIVYHDEDVIVVNKPAGMVTHPAHGATGGTLVNALLGRFGGLPGEVERAGLIHRLDRDTSGLLLVARTERALGTLGRAMQKRHIERRYRGIVVGTPRDPEGTITGPIGRDPNNRLRYAIRGDGKPAVTHYALREKLRGAAELEFRLETGRTHQIRVHFAALGTPVFNDPLYGKRDPRTALPGQALHAWRLAFKHPVSRVKLDFEIEPPQEYLATLDVLRADAS